MKRIGVIAGSAGLFTGFLALTAIGVAMLPDMSTGLHWCGLAIIMLGSGYLGFWSCARS